MAIEFKNYSPFKTNESKREYIIQDKRGKTPEGYPYLDVTLVATHSGIANLNHRFYIPSRMRDGCHTLVNEIKPLKILKNHGHDKAFGIILGAEYVDTTPKNLIYNKDVIIMNSSDYSIEDQSKAVGRFLVSGIPFEENWQGLGYIKIKARILDEQTIKDIDLGLFDSVSTSFSPDKAFCSVLLLVKLFS
jgi:hypothetical protein